ncbi:ribonuclease H-like domain-containing protein [Tanacetum coccineum]
MNEQSHYKQEKTKIRPKKAKHKRHIFNIGEDKVKNKITSIKNVNVGEIKADLNIGEIVSLNYIKSNKNVIGLIKSKEVLAYLVLLIVVFGSTSGITVCLLDDIILTTSSTTLLQHIIGSLHGEFAIIDLGSLSYFLVCPYMPDTWEPHLLALKRILCYVRGTLDYGIQLHASSTTQLVAYTDANWAGCLVTLHSTFGYYVFLGDNLLSWSAK